MKSVMTVVGARPQFVKAAVVSAELARQGSRAPFKEVLVHTGQHYDQNMSEVFFSDLGLSEPDLNLHVGSNSPGRQTADLMTGLETAVKQFQPDAVLAYGDTVSTLAAALTAAQHDLPFIHIEAGERTFRRVQMPEETNRIVADQCAGLCLTTTQRASAQLESESFHPRRIRFVGDTMYDLFLMGVERLNSQPSTILTDLGLRGDYVLATIHRVENTAAPEVLIPILTALDTAPWPVLLPVHPRVRNLLETWGWQPTNSLRLHGPLGYFDMLAALLNARKVVTDSGGVTREAFFAGKPAILPVLNNAWAQIVESGWAVETGQDAGLLAASLAGFEAPTTPKPNVFGDGRAAEKIVNEVAGFLDWPDHDGPWHTKGWWRELRGA